MSVLDEARRKGKRQHVESNGKKVDVEKPPTETVRQSAAHSANRVKDDLIHRTDLGNAKRIVRDHGRDLRYCWPWKSYLAWDGRRWKIDATAESMRRAKDTVIAMFSEANEEVQAVGRAMKDIVDDQEREVLGRQLKVNQKTLAWALKSEAAARLNAAIGLLRSEPGVSVDHDELDLQPWAINCLNGTLDLRSLELRNHCRDDLLTQLAPVSYSPTALCPTWERFVLDIFGHDPEMVTYLKRIMGRCLSGDVSEHILPIFHGAGANGKSVLLGVVVGLLGPDYAMFAPAGLLMTAKSERHPTELADLFRKRLVVTTEPEQGCRLNEGLVKLITGNDRIRARRMCQNFWEYAPTHKVILQTNHYPRVQGNDTGIWRRLKLVPFLRTYWDPDDPANQSWTDLDPALRQDKGLRQKLDAERDGIFRWLVEGYFDWQREGLTMPNRVAGTTTAFREDQDKFGEWLDERCYLSPEVNVKASDLYASYCGWCAKNGEKPIDRTPFGESMGRKFERYSNNGTRYRGLMLRPQEEGLPD